MTQMSDETPRRDLPQPVKFLVVGGAGYAINLALFTGLVGADAPYAGSATVSYLLSNLMMFFGNRYWTFGRRGAGLWPEYVRYFTVGLLVLASNLGVLALLIEGPGLEKVLAQAISLLVITPVAFVANKWWTFKSAPAA